MRSWLVLAALLTAIQAMPLHAERDPLTGAPVSPKQKRPNASPITDRFYVMGAFFNPAVSTALRVDGQSPAAGVPGRIGTVVSGEKDLGLSGRIPQGDIELMVRLEERNRLRVDYFETRRYGNQTLKRPIFFGDLDFNVGDAASSFLDFRSFDLTYTYSFIRNERFEVGTGLAVHFLEADGIGQVQARNERKEVTGAGAFPTIPLDFTWVISRHFAFTTRAQYFRASVSGFTGAVGQYHGDFQYRWKRNFTLGAGYTRMKWLLDVNDANFPGTFRLDVRGPEAFFKVSF
jgi:hypothetical protein